MVLINQLSDLFFLQTTILKEHMKPNKLPTCDSECILWASFRPLSKYAGRIISQLIQPLGRTSRYVKLHCLALGYIRKHRLRLDQKFKEIFKMIFFNLVQTFPEAPLMKRNNYAGISACWIHHLVRCFIFCVQKSGVGRLEGIGTGIKFYSLGLIAGSTKGVFTIIINPNCQCFYSCETSRGLGPFFSQIKISR